MTDYYSVSADELLAALGQAVRTVDLDLIRACLERREDIQDWQKEVLLEAEEGLWVHRSDPRPALASP